MDVTARSTAGKANRHQTGVAGRAVSAACGSASGRDVSKKSRSAADLQRPGRDVAKDNGDIATIAVLTKSLDQSDRSGAEFSACGRTSAESLLTVPGMLSHRSTSDRRVTREPGCGLGWTGDKAANCGDPLNIKLTEDAGAARATVRRPRSTNLSSAWLCKVAQPGSAIDGVVTHPVGSHELCYAGI